MPVEAVIFDWDGTLFDSAAASLRAFQKMFREYGIEMTGDLHDELYTPDWYQMYTALGMPRERWPEADQRWMHHYSDEEPGLVEGAWEMIERLRARGMRLGIVSSGTRSRILREITRLGLDGVFDAVVCNEDVKQRKPHPEGLLQALETLGCKAQHCFFVGDTPDDIGMGKAAKAITVAVENGYVPGRRLAECNPDFMVASASEVAGILELDAGRPRGK